MRKQLFRLTSFVLMALPLAAQAQPRPFGNLTLQQLIGNVVRSLVGFMGSISLAMFIYGGFLWMTASGSEERVKKAKSTITYSAFGIVITFSAYAAVAFILSTLQTAATSSGT